MLRKKILVLLGSLGQELNSAHYALALAERLGAQLYLLRYDTDNGSDSPVANWLDEALGDLINSARQAGITVSHHIADVKLKEQIINLVKVEGIDMLIFGEGNAACEHLMLQIKDLIPGQIIQVREKDAVSYL